MGLTGSQYKPLRPLNLSIIFKVPAKFKEKTFHFLSLKTRIWEGTNTHRRTHIKFKQSYLFNPRLSLICPLSLSRRLCPVCCRLFTRSPGQPAVPRLRRGCERGSPSAGRSAGQRSSSPANLLKSQKHCKYTHTLTHTQKPKTTEPFLPTKQNFSHSS